MKHSKDKSLAIAYFLLVTCGFLGIHRFYLGKNISGFLFIILAYSYLPFTPAIIFLGICLIIDIFLLPTLVKSKNSLKYYTLDAT